MKEIITDLTLLTTPAEPLKFITDTGIDKTEGLNIISELKEVLESSSNLIAIAAPQLGINRRIFCIKFNDTIKTFINPIVTKKTGNQITPETFSSMPGKEILIGRPTEMTVVYYTEDFKYEENKLLGAAAKIFDQQIQLLDGVLPNELGLVSDVEQDGSLADATEEEIAQILDLYKKFIAAKAASFEQAIAEDDKLNEQYKQLKFTENVINGRTKVVAENPAAPVNRAQRRAAAKAAKAINRLGGRKK